jgi:hypothetical protein
MMQTINFGKYKGERLKDILKKDPSYIKWLHTDCNDMDIRFACGELLGYNSTQRVITIVKKSLMLRGYSEAEALMFIRVIKDKE